MNVLVVDVGGTNVKILATGQKESRRFPSGPTMTPRSGTMLFLGFGTGLGSALVVNGTVVPMELGHLSYKNATYEDYVGARGLDRLGRKKWTKHVEYGVDRMIDVLNCDDVVLGGGNVKRLKELPPGCRAGDNANAFLGGFRLWENAGRQRPSTRTKGRTAPRREKRR